MNNQHRITIHFEQENLSIQNKPCPLKQHGSFVEQEQMHWHSPVHFEIQIRIIKSCSRTPTQPDPLQGAVRVRKVDVLDTEKIPSCGIDGIWTEAVIKGENRDAHGQLVSVEVMPSRAPFS